MLPRALALVLHIFGKKFRWKQILSHKFWQEQIFSHKSAKISCHEKTKNGPFFTCNGQILPLLKKFKGKPTSVYFHEKFRHFHIFSQENFDTFDTEIFCFNPSASWAKVSILSEHIGILIRKNDIYFSSNIYCLGFHRRGCSGSQGNLRQIGPGLLHRYRLLFRKTVVWSFILDFSTVQKYYFKTNLAVSTLLKIWERNPYWPLDF